MIPRMRRHLQVNHSDGLMMGDANGLPKENKHFFGRQGEVMQMMFNNHVNQHLFSALATGKTKPLENALEMTRDIPETAQWAQCLSQHDVSQADNLEKLKQHRILQKLGLEKETAQEDNSVPCRLAPMLQNDSKRIKLAYSLLFSLPSTPVIRYGEELGMGSNPSLPGKESIKTPMQWNGYPNAGFSEKEGIFRSVTDTGEYTYKKINVALQSQDPNSLLNWMAQMIEIRKQCPEIAFGTWEVLKMNSPHLFAIRYRYKGRSLLVIHNFSNEVLKAEISKKSAGTKRMKDLLTLNESFSNNDGKHDIYMAAYSYRWFRY